MFMKKSSNKVVLLLAYSGSGYAGWQRQTKDRSIQEVVEDALAKVLKRRVVITASGRTDAGVHAYGQVVHFIQPEHAMFYCPHRIKKMLNALLPPDIVVRTVHIADAGFHARFKACAKEYRYALTRAMKPLPWHQGRVYHPRHVMDTEYMQEGAQYLLGKHDFASFANHGRDYTSTVRTLFKLDIVDEGELVMIHCRGDGFLYKMVRNIVGALLDLSRHKYSIDYLREMLEQKNRRSGPPAAPAYGLTLHHVCYHPPYDFFCSNCSMHAVSEG